MGGGGRGGPFFLRSTQAAFSAPGLSSLQPQDEAELPGAEMAPTFSELRFEHGSPPYLLKKWMELIIHLYQQLGTSQMRCPAQPSECKAPPPTHPPTWQRCCFRRRDVMQRRSQKKKKVVCISAHAQSARAQTSEWNEVKVYVSPSPLPPQELKGILYNVLHYGKKSRYIFVVVVIQFGKSREV